MCFAFAVGIFKIDTVQKEATPAGQFCSRLRGNRDRPAPVLKKYYTRSPHLSSREDNMGILFPGPNLPAGLAVILLIFCPADGHFCHAGHCAPARYPEQLGQGHEFLTSGLLQEVSLGMQLLPPRLKRISLL